MSSHVAGAHAGGGRGRGWLALVDDLPAPDGFPGPLRLRRAWPRSDTHVLLEYTTPTEPHARVVGQWVGNDARAFARAAETRAACRALFGTAAAAVRGRGVLVQRPGADRRLTALPELAAEPSATVVAHRPERRAVLRIEGPARRWMKVVPPGRLERLLAGTAHVRVLGSAVPRLEAVDEDRGVSVWSDLPGVALADLVGRSADAAAAVAGTGVLLRRLHRIPPPSGPPHDAAAEAAVLRRWLNHLAVFDPATHGCAEPLLAPVAGLLAAHRSRRMTTVHRDLHDGQVIIGGLGVGLLDLDTVSAGEAELDLGNLIAHIRLAACQGRCTQEDATTTAEALLDAYGHDAVAPEALRAYTAAALLRLVGVHALRPLTRGCLTGLLTQVQEVVAEGVALRGA